jgi:hypothetical protein
MLIGLVLILFITSSIAFAEDPPDPEDIPNGIPTEEEMEPPNFVESYLAKGLVSLGDSMYWAMDKLGLSINAIVYSQDIAGKEINKLKFTFDNSTIYGRVGKLLYATFKGLALMLMVSILTWIGIKFMTKKSSHNKLIFKQMIQYYVLTMILLFAMPRLLNIFNTLILLICRGLSTGDSGLAFVETLRTTAVTTGRGWDALLYCGSTGLTIWFAFIYAYRNMFMLFLFMYFPIFALFLNGESLKPAFDRWGKEMFSIVSVPLIDAGLLYAVIKLMEFGITGFLAFLFTAFIIPVRGYLRSMVGLGGMKSEIMGFAGLAGLTGLAVAGIRGAKGGIQGIASGIGDKLESRRFGQSGGVDEAINADEGMTGFSQSNAYKCDTPDAALATSTKGINTSFNGLNMMRRRLDIPLKMPKNGEDVYSYNLDRQGNRKILKTLGNMGGSLLGVGVAGAATSLLGPAISTNAMRVGGELGGAVGELTGEYGHALATLGGFKFINHAGEELGGSIFDKVYNGPKVDLTKKKKASSGNDMVLRNTTQLGNIDATATSNDSININIDDLDKVQSDNIEELDSDTGFALNKGADAQSIHQDATEMMDSELEVQIRNEANESAVDLTGIDPRELKKEWEGHVGQKSTKLRQSYSDKGIEISKQVEEEIRKQSETYGHEKVDTFSKLDTFDQVRNMEYNRIAIEKTYEKLKDNGYAASALDDMSMKYKKEIADLIRKDLQSQQNHTDTNDIDINMI